MVRREYKARQLDLENVEKYFEHKGYTIQQIEQKYRHVTGILKKNKREEFLKLASTPIITKRTENEVAWNKQLHPHGLKPDFPFYTPKVYNSGRYGKLFWFTCENFDPKTALSDRKILAPNFAKKFLPKVIDILITIPTLKVRLPSDKHTEKEFNHKGYNIKAVVLNYLRRYANEIKYDYSALEKIIKQSEISGTGLAHVEVMPWHMFKYKGKIALIDAEFSSNRVVKYYDVTSLCARLYTELKRPDIYFKTVQMFEQRLSGKEKPRFREQFRALLAYRAMGQLRDATLSKKSTKYEEELISRILENSIFE